MNYGPLVFLTAFVALSASWFGFVLTPQIQIGRLTESTNTLNTAELYPKARPGQAAQGLQVYRANGCAACHTQQTVQEGTSIDVYLLEVGTNAAAVSTALVKANVGFTRIDDPGFFLNLPKNILPGTTIEAAKRAFKGAQSAGAKAQIRINPQGPDIARHWGVRGSVAADYLFDQPVMLGSQRVGPDLSNVGARLPDVNWHLLHLYAPQQVVKGSLMPPHRFLFNVAKAGQHTSPDALQVPPEVAPAPGYEVVPKPEAVALAAYLVSLNSSTPVFETPMTLASSATSTNSPAK
jgi:cytochrome c oxidase cbb3-type subunit 2